MIHIMYTVFITQCTFFNIPAYLTQIHRRETGKTYEIGKEITTTEKTEHLYRKAQEVDLSRPQSHDSFFEEDAYTYLVSRLS